MSSSSLPPRRLWPIIVIGLVVFAAYQLTKQPASPATPAPAQSASDATIKAAMIGNLRDQSASTWYAAIHLDNGLPDIAVTGGVLIVATLLEPTAIAAATSVCHSIAAFTNDSNTAAPLGVKQVTIISGGQRLVDCKPSGS
jgi:hypothetical protein